MNEIANIDIKDIFKNKDKNEFINFYFNPFRGIILVKDNKVYSGYEANTDTGYACRLQYIIHSDDNLSNIIGEENIDKRYAIFNPLSVNLYLERHENKDNGQFNYYGEEAYGNVRLIRGKNKTVVIAASIKSLDISSRNIQQYFNTFMGLIKKLLPEDKIDVYLLKSNKDRSDFDFLKLDENEKDFLGERYKLEEVAKDAGCSVDSLHFDKNFVNLVN